MNFMYHIETCCMPTVTYDMFDAIDSIIDGSKSYDEKN